MQLRREIIYFLHSDRKETIADKMKLLLLFLLVLVLTFEPSESWRGVRIGGRRSTGSSPSRLRSSNTSSKSGDSSRNQSLSPSRESASNEVDSNRGRSSSRTGASIRSSSGPPRTPVKPQIERD